MFRIFDVLIDIYLEVYSSFVLLIFCCIFCQLQISKLVLRD